MRVAYLDCFAGIAGDMLLGALMEAGVPAQVLEEATATLGIGASLRFERVDRSGISATKVHVLEHGTLAEGGDALRAPGQATPLEQQRTKVMPFSPQPQTQHEHKGGHSPDQQGLLPAQDDEFAHNTAQQCSAAHGRSLSAIRVLIQQSALHDEVKDLAVRTFELLGTSEARIHNVPVEEIHFHEVGAVDAIVDVVASCAGVHFLQIGAWYSSPLNVGGGMVRCAHGTFPVPAPATADLLRGVPTYSAHLRRELVTPTGAALVRALAPQFGEQPSMRVERIGYGAGTRNPEGFPNVLRLLVGEAEDRRPDVQSAEAGRHPDSPDLQTIAVLETALDDASPQLLAFAAEQVLAHGALDVMMTPVIMKKGRPGTMLTVLCRPHESEALTALLLRETPTLGVRLRQEQRVCLKRQHVTVTTIYGPLRIKLGSDAAELRNAAPEFEDCKAAALKANAPLKQVQAAAMAAYAMEFPL